MTTASPASSDLLIAAASARGHEILHDLKGRNRVANEIFARRANRHVTHEGCSVETWWDRYSQNYITQFKDENGYQVGGAEYTGHREDAAVAHVWALQHLFGIKSHSFFSHNA